MAPDPATVTARLEAVMNEEWFEDRPFIVEFAEGRIPRERIARFGASYCYQVDNFKRCVAAVYAAAEPRDVRELLLDNLIEEHGDGDPQRDHTVLVARFGRALGADLPDPFNVEPIPESHEWVERILRVCRDEHFVVGLAGISYGIEARTRTMGFLGAIYRDAYGVSEHDLEFFTMHLEADEEHARRAIEMIQKYCTTDELLERSAWAVREVLAAHAVGARGFERICTT